jgi:hypothetical protein
MQQVGMFTANVLKALSEVWGCLEYTDRYTDRQDNHDGAKLTEEMLSRLHAEGLTFEYRPER